MDTLRSLCLWVLTSASYVSPCLALPCLGVVKLSVEFDEDAVLLLVTMEMTSETKVGSTHCIADVTPWGRCRVHMSAHATVIHRLVELQYVGVLSTLQSADFFSVTFTCTEVFSVENIGQCGRLSQLRWLLGAL